MILWLDGKGYPDVAEESLVYDPELNLLLDHIRTTRPLKLKCGEAECQMTLAYWGLSSGQQARVVPGPGRQRRGKRSAATYQVDGPYRPGGQQPKSTQIRGGAEDLVFPNFERDHRFDEAIEYGMRGEGIIRCVPNPEVPSGWPLKWEFHCPNPGRAHYEFTNSQMIRMFAYAAQHRLGTIHPGMLM